MRNTLFAILTLLPITTVIADTEPNNTWQTALALPQDRTIAGTQSDVDWYVINISSNQTVQRILIDLTFTHDDGNIDMQLYGDDFVISDPDGIIPGIARSLLLDGDTTDHEFIDHDVSSYAPRPLYMKVSGENLGNGYRLTWTELAGSDDGFEENDSSAAVKPITESVVAFGAQADEDWYSIEVSSGSTRLLASLRFYNTQFDKTIDLDLELREPGGTLIDSSANANGINESINTVVPTAGTYHLRILGDDNGDGYALSWAGVSPVSSAVFPVPAVNQAPTAIANTVTTIENTPYNFAVTDFTFSDSEGDALVSATLAKLSLGGGSLAHSGGTAVNSGDTLTAAQLATLVYTPAVDASGTPLASFDFTVNDFNAGTVAAQMGMNVTVLNSVPVAIANTVTTTENTPYNFALGDFTFSDNEGDSLSSATLANISLGGGSLVHSGGSPVNEADTLTAAQLDTLVYTPPVDSTGSPLATFDFTVNDLNTGTVAAQMDINVTAVPTTSIPTSDPAATDTSSSSGALSPAWLLALMLAGLCRIKRR